jgi:hypothetical protein
LSVILASCDTVLSTLHINTTHHAHVKAAKTHYLAEAYVKHLTLALLTLESAADAKAVKNDLDVVDAYAAQNPSKSEQQTLVVLDCKKDGNMETIVAPLVLSGKKQFSALLEIMNRLGGCTFYNLHVVSAVISPSDDLALPRDDIALTKQALDEQKRHLLDASAALPPLDDAQAELQLVRFFIDHRFRDAAYLSVDNVKRELASAQDGADTETIKKLSKELDAIEERLHKEMPFTLSAQ